jgi:hypothetical protein
VGDEQELRLRRHLAHQVAEALGVRVVERRVDLVQQAEGRGFSLKSENTSAIAVSAFSPPESSWIDEFFLPGGWAITTRPASRISSP